MKNEKTPPYEMLIRKNLESILNRGCGWLFPSWMYAQNRSFSQLINPHHGTLQRSFKLNFDTKRGANEKEKK